MWVRRVTYHAILAVGWAVVAVPAVLWWKESVTFLVVVAIYSNFATEIAAHRAVHADRDSVSNAQHDETVARLAAIEARLPAKESRPSA